MCKNSKRTYSIASRKKFSFERCIVSPISSRSFKILRPIAVFRGFHHARISGLIFCRIRGKKSFGNAAARDAEILDMNAKKR